MTSKTRDPSGLFYWVVSEDELGLYPQIPGDSFVNCGMPDVMIMDLYSMLNRITKSLEIL